MRPGAVLRRARRRVRRWARTATAWEMVLTIVVSAAATAVVIAVAVYLGFV